MISVKGVAIRPETQVVPVQEVSLQFGIAEQKVETLMAKYKLNSTMLADALVIQSEFDDSALFKVCELMRAHDGNSEVVREIYQVREELDDEASLVSISLLLQKFGGTTPQEVVEAVREAHIYSNRKWLASTVLDLVHIAESNQSIIYLDQLVNELQQLKL